MKWRYEWVAELPVDVYDVLIEELAKPSPNSPDFED